MNWFSFICGFAGGFVVAFLLMALANLVDRNMGYRK